MVGNPRTRVASDFCAAGDQPQHPDRALGFDPSTIVSYRVIVNYGAVGLRGDY
jgi:hypothetical protein